MSKEKRRVDLEEEKMYFYEISATIVILFSLITFSELGFVGKGLKSLVQIMFGDFYFVLIIYLILHGIFALVKRRWFDFSSVKFNGFIMFFISLITLNHIGFYERLGFSDTEIFSKSITTYANAFKNLIQITSYGGGVVGALFLQVLIFLFNSLGTMIILIVFLVLSLIFMTNFSYKTSLYYINILFKKFRTFLLLLYKYFHNIKFPTKTIKKAKLNLNLNLNLLDDCDNDANEAIAYKMCVETHTNLNHYIKSKNVVINSYFQLGFISSRYIFVCNTSNYTIEEIRRITNNNTIVYKEKNNIIIESSNSVKQLLTIKRMLLNTKKIPLGLEISKQAVVFNPLENKNLILVGSIDSGIKTYLKSFIVSNIFKYKNNFKLSIFDFNNEFIELKYLPNLLTPYTNNKKDLINNLNNIAKELERRIELINGLGYADYLEYNNLEQNKIPVIYVIINNISLVKDDIEKQEAKLLYFIKFGFRVGIHFIIVNRSVGINKELLVNIQTKVVFKCLSPSQSFEVLNNNNGCFLEPKADILINYLNTTLRCSAPYISNKDYEKVIAKFICN